MPSTSDVVGIPGLQAGEDVKIGEGFHPSDAFLRLSVPLGVLLTAFLAWKTQPRIVGCWYKTRDGDSRLYGELGAWFRAILGAAVPVFALAFTLAALGNVALGKTGVRHYVVSGHYVHSTRSSTCYGVDLVNPSEAGDNFSLCVGQTNQILDRIGSSMVVRERASWFGNQVFSYHKDESTPLD